jgi:hypothetical protein
LILTAGECATAHAASGPTEGPKVGKEAKMISKTSEGDGRLHRTRTRFAIAAASVAVVGSIGALGAGSAFAQSHPSATSATPHRATSVDRSSNDRHESTVAVLREQTGSPDPAASRSVSSADRVRDR